MKGEIEYFEEVSRENSEKTLKAALKRGEELGINTFILSSTTGRTGVQAIEILKGKNIIVVSHCYGSHVPDKWTMDEENLKILKSNNVSIVTAAHAFGAITRSMNQSKLKDAPFAYVIGDIVANSLRLFGQGLKVACEIACMAADAGLVRCDQEVISMGGSARVGGVDCALVLTPANSQRVFETRVREIICKPRIT